ncbi:hypothetical protein K469DRAFT_772012 [Zopfia rhizophila CBS 207.26]|uniref:Uncharacterized protein n=1 Tax=Zopfia rhizophila CBS 207.26 TaxID=1314779 RepID=A0A6A6E8J0_9PEZI|nr:hypothetical protein K469DRAFT_772012 [Zopfia rhizophila CBS 207.26]
MKTRQLSAGVHKARVTSNNKLYVYKEVDRPHYIPRDSQVLYHKLQNLQLFHGIKLIAGDSYQTTKAIKVKALTVLRGILLKYHLKGILKDALDHHFLKKLRCGENGHFRSPIRLLTSISMA